MHDKLSFLGADLLKETLPSIINGTNDSIPQDDNKATFASNISREDEKIDWTASLKRFTITFEVYLHGLLPIHNLKMVI